MGALVGGRGQKAVFIKARWVSIEGRPCPHRPPAGFADKPCGEAGCCLCWRRQRDEGCVEGGLH